jgi:hypothetical protein
MNNLAHTLKALGKNKAAIDLMQRSTLLSEKVLGQKSFLIWLPSYILLVWVELLPSFEAASCFRLFWENARYFRKSLRDVIQCIDFAARGTHNPD